MNSKLYYLTLNENVGGIFQSQVIDVIKLYKTNSINITLICFISLHSYRANRNKIKKLLPEAIVLPAVPKLKFFKLNKYLLQVFTNKNATIICRGIFATILAQSTKKLKVIYDGRGAITAEQNEYNVYANTGLEHLINEFERRSVLSSDFRIAVTNKLVEYWRQEFEYTQNEHVVIPCTVANHFLLPPNLKNIKKIKETFNIVETDIILSFVGGNSDWQSFDKIKFYIIKILNQNQNCKVFFISKSNTHIEDLQHTYPNRVFHKFVPPKEVPSYLDISSYGILFRENKITNKVASPVKCAEYLSRGLKVLISDNIGDYSSLLLSNNMGLDITKTLELTKPSLNEKIRIKNYAIAHFSKTSPTIQNSYKLLNQIKLDLI
ncbi:glycosyltransferase family 4 protein [Tamlana haliotis]|uniref:Glycosyltransferase family 4 protein n=1 Tax=Pseudotamlana haliotis TaxID=2614804 RepID=A0A6N6MEV2_9FLAO|nr:glycosyltransferase family 4 protein [Tamlana haliotis]KAB1067858.1 glycosyltransferase family 4 protein [Tamlana haliotis]